LGDSKTLKKLTSVNLADKPATDLKYNFYSIHNPKEYLGGSDAIVVEQGPYNLRCVLQTFCLVQPCKTAFDDETFAFFLSHTGNTPLHMMYLKVRVV
jgi:hypothetical protein